MRKYSCYFTTFFVTASPTTLAIYSLKFLVFNFLDIDFLASCSGHHCESQPVLVSPIIGR